MRTIGCWIPGEAGPAFLPEDLASAAGRFRDTSFVLRDPHSGHVGVGLGGQTSPVPPDPGVGYPLLAVLPPLYPEWLGDRSFLEAHGVRFPYVQGAMANGIATAEMVIAAARAGLLGFFGAGGLSLARVEAGVGEIEAALGGTPLPWGANLIHSPQEPALEEAVTDLYIQRGVRRISASAFLQLTPSVVRYAAHGLTRGRDGLPVRRNHVLCKISRPELARAFLAPPPAAMLQALVDAGRITPDERDLAASLPVAEDVIAEADSGGHTDNRPLVVLLPALRAVADELTRAHGYRRPIRVGAAGGLGAPQAVAAAFSLGASFVLTGSVNQACVESGLAPAGRALLAQADLADVAMAPAADMFEMGVKLQVLRRGSMFAARAQQLYDAYVAHDSLEDLAPALRERLERRVLGVGIDEIWTEAQRFWTQRDPEQLEEAARDPKHRMALVFRWYLGKSSHWAIVGDEGRKADYQIWCGPAMGAFNQWVAGSFLEDPAQRTVASIAWNLLEGAAAVTRAQQLRSHGVPLPAAAFAYRPRPLALGTSDLA